MISNPDNSLHSEQTLCVREIAKLEIEKNLLAIRQKKNKAQTANDASL